MKSPENSPEMKDFFFLQLLRGLLEDSPQLLASSGIALVEESLFMEGHAPFQGHLTPMTDE